MSFFLVIRIILSGSSTLLCFARYLIFFDTEPYLFVLIWYASFYTIHTASEFWTLYRQYCELDQHVMKGRSQSTSDESEILNVSAIISGTFSREPEQSVSSLLSTEVHRNVSFPRQRKCPLCMDTCIEPGDISFEISLYCTVSNLW